MTKTITEKLKKGFDTDDLLKLSIVSFYLINSCREHMRVYEFFMKMRKIEVFYDLRCAEKVFDKFSFKDMNRTDTVFWLNYLESFGLIELEIDPSYGLFIKPNPKFNIKTELVMNLDKELKEVIRDVSSIVTPLSDINRKDYYDRDYNYSCYDDDYHGYSDYDEYEMMYHPRWY